SQAAINQAKSGVTTASVNESYGTVVAPFDGIVIEKMAYLGETTNPYSTNGTALLKIENPDRLQLEISVPEENLRFVRVGQSVQVQVDAANQTLNATIQQIIPVADANSRSFLVKIPLTNSGRLISGMFGRIALPSGGKQETILIPAKALIQRGQLQGVYVVNSNVSPSTAVLRWVKTGQQRDGNVEIVSGLMTGDRMITNNIEQLSDGQPITFNQ
ncbi:MAG: efflux RND transporter periplasmic adaptor subunit, partial [Kovacikia sp.]